jgi:hypothetical protein
MSPLLDIQKRMAEIGRVRMGIKNERGLPTKLDRFRITSQSRDVVEAVASLHGGDVREWKPNPKSPPHWEVVTTTNTLDVVVAPGQVLSQWWEKWKPGTCERRCDGVTEQLTDSPCVCPASLDDRRKAAAAKPPTACRPVTRFSFMIRDIPMLGLFRLETRGEIAAAELSGIAMFLEMATTRGLFIPATLVAEQRGVGSPHQYVVPVLHLHNSYQQVAEALGMDMAMEPKALPAADTEPPYAYGVEPTPSYRAALPAAPKGRLPKTALPSDSPPLPDDPTFTFASSTGPTLAPAPDEPQLQMAVAPKARPQVDAQTKRAQQIHIAARNGDLLEMLDDLVAHVTGGRSKSTKDVEDNEASALYDIMFRMKRGKLVAAYDPDGKLRLVEQ